MDAAVGSVVGEPSAERPSEPNERLGRVGGEVQGAFREALESRETERERAERCEDLAHGLRRLVRNPIRRDERVQDRDVRGDAAKRDRVVAEAVAPDARLGLGHRDEQRAFESILAHARFRAFQICSAGQRRAQSWGAKSS